MEKTIAAAMCIDPELDYFGRSAAPVAVYDAATLAVLGQTEGPVERDASGRITGRFAGCAFTAMRANPASRWYVLRVVEAAP